MTWQHARQHDPYLAYDRFQFPGFDAYPYLAMAERPSVFTVAPWGYRVLTPWLVHAVTERNLVRGFRRVSIVALTAAAVLLFLFLRRLGHPPPLALLGAVLFCVSGPVSEVAAYPFLAEPLTVALEIAFLLALRCGAPAGGLAVIAVLGVLSKEFFLLLLPLVYLERRALGVRRAALQTLVVAAPTLLAGFLLRAFWAPHLDLPLPGVGIGAVATAASRVRETWPEWWLPLLLSGLVPLALVGALLPAGRTLRAAAAWLALATLVPPFFNPVTFFGADIPRLLLYVLPLCIALALVTLAQGWPSPAVVPPATPPASAPFAFHLLALLAVLLALGPLLVIDRYRRDDLTGPRDGPLILAVSRESWRCAARLERGLVVVLDPRERAFQWGVSDPGDLSRMRWFLRGGFGEQPHYGTGAVRVQDSPATVLMPLWVPRLTRATFLLQASSVVRLEILANGARVAAHTLRAGENTVAVDVAPERLFRGDNELTLHLSPGATPVHLVQLQYEVLR